MLSLNLPPTHRISFQEGLALLKERYAKTGHCVDITLHVIGLYESFQVEQRVLVESIANKTADELIATLDTRGLVPQFMDTIKTHNSKQPTSESYEYIDISLQIRHASGFCLK